MTSLESLGLPDGVTFLRSTPLLDDDSVPEGLRRAHQMADGVWGLLCVEAGEVTFVAEETGASRVVRAEEGQVIEPGVRHHVELGPNAAFRIEFYR